MGAPAGWYPQPDGQQRYWDGELWTDHFAPGVPPVTTPATGGEPARPVFEDEHVIPMGDQLTPAPQFVATKGSNGLAFAGFVLALLGLIFGIIGLVQSAKTGAGNGLSIAAIILSVTAIVISIAAIASVKPTVKTRAITYVGRPIALTGYDGSAVTVVVKKIVDPTDSTDEFSTPAPDSRYVAVQFQITNTGTVPYKDYPGFGAKVSDAEGRQFGNAFTEGVTAGVQLPDSVKLLPGKTALGYIVFEVPKASKVTSVQLGLDFGDGNTGEWRVK